MKHVFVISCESDASPEQMQQMIQEALQQHNCTIAKGTAQRFLKWYQRAKKQELKELVRELTS